MQKLERFIEEKEAAARNLTENNEKAEEPASKRRKVEPEEPSPQSPMTITESETSQAGSINMLTEGSTRQEDHDQPTQLDRWSHHHHRQKMEKHAKRMDERKLIKLAKRNQNYHIAWFNLW